MTRIAVLGTTSWGTTLAALLARNGSDVTLLARTVAEADALNQARENFRHRPGLPFPDRLTAGIDLEAVATAGLLLLAVPSETLRRNLTRIAPAIAPDTLVLSATKGLEPESCLRMSEVIAAFGVEAGRILALSGPNFAAEIASGLPAATVVAGADRAAVERVQALLTGPTFRVYAGDDVAGVEVGGALKNVIAIACGISDGLGYGANARAALITRGLAEITRLGVASGARPMTFLGLAGIGDLVLSCGSDLSRNRRLGLALAAGLSLEAATASIEGVIEGSVTARAVPVLARRKAIEMPISDALHAVLYEGRSAADAVTALMSRAPKPEFAD